MAAPAPARRHARRSHRRSSRNFFGQHCNPFCFGDALCAHSLRSDRRSPRAAARHSCSQQWPRGIWQASAFAGRRPLVLVLITRISPPRIPMESMIEDRNRRFNDGFFPLFFGGGFGFPLFPDDVEGRSRNRSAASGHRAIRTSATSQKARRLRHASKSSRLSPRRRKTLPNSPPNPMSSFAAMAPSFLRPAYAWGKRHAPLHHQ